MFQISHLTYTGTVDNIHTPVFIKKKLFHFIREQVHDKKFRSVLMTFVLLIILKAAICIFLLPQN
jgi:hypothetical protein